METSKLAPDLQPKVEQLLAMQGPPRPISSRSLPLETLNKDAISLVESDPKTYQFRIHTDTHGIDKTHKITRKHWDAVLDGDPLILHERKDGKRFVADGHHRLSFAKSLIEKGEGPEQLAAYILKESEGYTAQDAKIIAAYKNIARGDGNVVEAALVLKEAREQAVHQELLPALDTSRGNLSDAATLSHLSKDSLAVVGHGEVPVAMAVDAAKTETPDAVVLHIAEILKHKGKVLTLSA
jgi:hypothetical protein